MENTIVAQNTCLQMSVVGRHSFIGAGCTFTDYNLLGKPLRVKLSEAFLRYLGNVSAGCLDSYYREFLALYGMIIKACPRFHCQLFQPIYRLLNLFLS